MKNMKHNIKKHTGVILILAGIVLTLERTEEFSGIVENIALYVREYWPIVLCVLGIYLLAAPKKGKQRK